MATLILQPDASGGIETFLYNWPGNENWNWGIGSDIQTGQENGEARRALIKFDLSSIPSNVVIESAILRLRVNGAANATATDVSIHRSLVEWFEGAQNGGIPAGGENASTWSHRNFNGSVTWAGGAGGASGTEWVASATDTTSVSATGVDYDWDVTVDVADFYNGVETNHGWWMIGDEVTADTRKAFRSSDSGVTGSRPQLIIEYNFIIDVADTVAVSDFIDIVIVDDFIYAINVADVINVAENAVAVIGNYNLSVSDTVAIADTAAVYPIYWSISETDSITVTDSATVLTENLVVSFSDGVSVGETVSFEIISPFSIASRVAVEPAPLLYITDGTLKSNGQLNKIDLMGGHGAYCVDEWLPAVAQWKEGGHWSNSPLATGRRPILRRFANVIDIFTLKARAPTQNGLIGYINDLDNLLEAAANYHISRWSNTPIYLVARAHYETNTRYALIYAGDVPELGDVSGQPFMTYHNRHAAFSELTLRIEHGIWQHLPPGQSEAVPISSFRSYTVTGWSS